MSFFIRVWCVGNDIPFINSRTNEITSDMVDIPNSIVWDAEVSGDYMDAGEVRDALSVSANGLTILGRTLTNMRKSTR